MSQNQEFKGKNGTLVLTSTGVIIKRGMRGALLGAGRGDKTIPYSSITAVQFKKAGMLSGYLQLTLHGGIEQKGGTMGAMQDENTVSFNSGKSKDFARAKELIEEKIMQASQGVVAVSSMDELEKLADLKEKGILTEDEFNVKKRQLLDL